MVTRSIIFFLVIVSTSIAAPRGKERPVPADPSYPANILISERAAAKADTVYLLGGPDRDDGTFESGGLPDWHGWYGVDRTERTDTKWRVDLYNSPTGTPAAWCGEMIPSCGGDDPEGGYGNNYEEYLDWTGSVADPGLPTDVTVTMTLNHDNEPGYDYLHLQHASAAGWTTVRTWNGSNAVGGVFTPLDEVIPFTVASEDLQDGTVVLRLSATSDVIWSDADCQWPTAGHAQIDDLGVQGDNGLVGTVDDFESGLEASNWHPGAHVAVGDFAKVWPLLENLDECTDNHTPQAAFIDDGVVVPCTGGTLGTTWTYGPGGYAINLNGGCAGPAEHLWNEIWSPPIAYADPVTGAPLGSSHTGAVLEYEIMKHLPLTNGAFAVWHVRSSTDDGNNWTEWRDWNYISYFYSSGYIRLAWDVGRFLVPDPTHVQIALGVYEIGWIWGFTGQDPTPAPYYDNVALKVYTIDGPTISTRELEQAQDSFPTIGTIDYVDLGANSIRFDMANDIIGDLVPAILPGDSITFDVVATRPGSVLTGLPRLHYAMKPNPLFDPYRLHPVAGSVAGDTVFTSTGVVVPDRYAFDLPDEDFFFPGDVIHYYIRAEDVSPGFEGSSTLPADLSGFGVFPGDPGYVPNLYHSSFTVRGLPSLGSATPGDHPPILFYNDFGSRGEENEWMTALGNLGYVEGEDYDIYYTNAPGSGVSNGLGSRATLDQITGYSTMLYTFGDLTMFSLTTFDQASDKSNDLALVDAWLQTGRNMMLTGDNIAHDLSLAQGNAGVDFVDTWLSIDYIQHSVNPLLGGDLNPVVVPVEGNSMGIDTEFRAYGECPSENSFDAVAPVGDVETLLRWSGFLGVESAGFLNTHMGSRVAFFPVSFFNMWSLEDNPGPLAARTHLLDRVLTYFGETPSGPPTQVPGDVPRVLTADAYPNPFNPATTVAYEVPRRGPATVRIYDVRGQLVRTLVDEAHEAGRYTAVWNGRNDDGAAIASGVYFAEVRSGGESVVRKLALVK